MSLYALAVDLGGTNLRVAAVREDGTIEAREKLPAEAKKGHTHVLASVAGTIKRLADPLLKKGGKIVGVGLGFPGIVDGEAGIVYQSPHFPDWDRLELRSFFEKEFSWPIRIDNDATLAAWGEGWLGVAKDFKNFVMLTLGTGIGGGIVVDGKILHGDSGFAGEVGHLAIESEGVSCACGGNGCLEMYASATGILRLAEELDDTLGREKLLARLGIPINRLTVAQLYEAAREGDIFSNVLFKKMGRYLGIGIASLVNILGIENIVLGGGVAQAWDFFIEPAKKEIGERTYRETARRIKFHRAQLGDDAGLIGAARSVFSS